MTSEGGVAVIGGGPAGLAAAWRLSSAGVRSRVYEASDRIGGRLRTERVGGRSADVVVQMVSSHYLQLRELLDDLGLGDRLVAVPGRDALWRGGRAHALRYGSVSSMVASGALPAGLKMKLGLRYLPFLERHAGVLELNDPARAAEAGLDDRSIAEWGTEVLGDGFVEALAYPLLAAYYAVAPEEASAALFHGLARAGMGVEVLAAREGFGPLAGEVAEALRRRGVDFRTGSPVRSLEVTASGVRIATEDGAADHDGAVLAVPAAAASRLMPDAVLPRRARTRSTALLMLSTREVTQTGWFGLSIPRTEPPGRTLAAVCVQEEKGTSVVAPDDGRGGALVLVPAPGVGERWADEAPDVALREGLAALDALLPEVRPRVDEARLIRLPDTVWVPGPGWFTGLGAEVQKGLPGRVALAGDYTVSPTVEGAVRSGIAAADRLAGDPVATPGA